MTANQTFAACKQWFEARDDTIHFAHDSINWNFRNGDHFRQDTESLVQELATRQQQAQDLPTLVCIDYQGAYRVIFRNRRLYCYKECSRRHGIQVWFQMILHRFPQCERIQDQTV